MRECRREKYQVVWFCGSLQEISYPVWCEKLDNNMKLASKYFTISFNWLEIVIPQNYLYSIARTGYETDYIYTGKLFENFFDYIEYMFIECKWVYNQGAIFSENWHFQWDHTSMRFAWIVKWKAIWDKDITHLTEIKIVRNMENVWTCMQLYTFLYFTSLDWRVALILNLTTAIKTKKCKLK